MSCDHLGVCPLQPNYSSVPTDRKLREILNEESQLIRIVRFLSLNFTTRQICLTCMQYKKERKARGEAWECARNNPNSSVQPGECRGAQGQDSNCAVPSQSRVPCCWSSCPLYMRQCHVVQLSLDICSKDRLWNSQNPTLYTHS